MTQHLSVTGWAKHYGTTERTARRWLAAGEIPAATKDPRTGEWHIPPDAVRVQTLPDALSAPAGAVAVTGPGRAPRTLADALDTLPGYLTVDETARLLGISPYAVRSRAIRYRGERVGEGGAWMFPQAVVREIAGLRR